MFATGLYLQQFEPAQNKEGYGQEMGHMTKKDLRAIVRWPWVNSTVCTLKKEAASWATWVALRLASNFWFLLRSCMISRLWVWALRFGTGREACLRFSSAPFHHLPSQKKTLQKNKQNPLTSITPVQTLVLSHWNYLFMNLLPSRTKTFKDRRQSPYPSINHFLHCNHHFTHPQPQQIS